MSETITALRRLRRAIRALACETMVSWVVRLEGHEWSSECCTLFEYWQDSRPPIVPKEAQQ